MAKDFHSGTLREHTHPQKFTLIVPDYPLDTWNIYEGNDSEMMINLKFYPSAFY